MSKKQYLLKKIDEFIKKDSDDIQLSDFMVVFELLEYKTTNSITFYRVTKSNVKRVYEQIEIDNILYQLKIKYNSYIKMMNVDYSSYTLKK